MRALYGLAQTEAQLGNSDEAIALSSRLLELNPNDNQGVRYQILTLLLVKGDTPPIHVLLRQYKDDPGAVWTYGRALAAFLERGNTRHARAQLQEALYQNIYFPGYLLQLMPVPEEPPLYGEFGTESEGLGIYFNQAVAWYTHEHSIDWMAEVIERTPTPAQRGMW